MSLIRWMIIQNEAYDSNTNKKRKPHPPFFLQDKVFARKIEYRLFYSISLPSLRRISRISLLFRLSGINENSAAN